MGLVEIVSTAGKVIAATWRHGSRFLFSIAGCCGAAAMVVRLAAFFEMAKAKGLWEECGLILVVVAVVAAVLALFKYYAEQQNRLVVLIADGQQSSWHHAPQADGTLLTHFAL